MISPASTDAASQVARILLEIDAIHVNAETPFTFTSGWKSPVYIDCRKVIGYPRARRVVTELAASKILKDVGAEALDVVAGGETAGIPFAAWMADALLLPMSYVRKKAKGFGRNARIEGNITPGARTLLVEDLSTDGRSKASFCEGLRQSGAVVDHAFVVFYYDIFPESEQLFTDLGITLHNLATWWDVLRVARDREHFGSHELATVEAFLNDPVGWSASQGGVGR